MNKTDLKIIIDKRTDDVIESLFHDIHIEAGSKSGDITPSQLIKLEAIKKDLKELIFVQVTQNVVMEPFKDMFWDMDKAPADLKRLFAPVEYQDGLSYAQCANLLHDVKKLGYTFDYGLDGVPFALRPKGMKLNEVEGFEDEEE